MSSDLDAETRETLAPAAALEAATASEETIVSLYRAYRDRLLGHAYGITRDFHFACDVVQETFLRASREPRLAAPDFHVRAWLLRVCGNLALNRLRDEGRRRERDGSPGLPPDDSGIRGLSLDGVSQPADPAEEVIRRQMGEELLKAMAELPATYRRALMLRYGEGLTCTDIAALLEVPAGTVMSWIHRARQVLRRRLEHE